MRAAASCDRSRRMRGLGQRGHDDLIRIRKSCLLASQRTHADTLLDAVRAVLDDAVLERPGLITTQLKIKVGVVDAVAHDTAEYRGNSFVVQSGRRENRLARDVERRNCAR